MSLAGRALGFSPAVVSKRIKRLGTGWEHGSSSARRADLAHRSRPGFLRSGARHPGRARGAGSIFPDARRRCGTLKVSAPTSFGRMHIAPHLKNFMDATPILPSASCSPTNSAISSAAGSIWPSASRAHRFQPRRPPTAPVRRVLFAVARLSQGQWHAREHRRSQAPPLPAGTQ